MLTILLLATFFSFFLFFAAYSSIFERGQVNKTKEVYRCLKLGFEIDKHDFKGEDLYVVNCLNGHINLWADGQWSFHSKAKGCEVCGFMSNWWTGLEGYVYYMKVTNMIKDKIESLGNK